MKIGQSKRHGNWLSCYTKIVVMFWHFCCRMLCGKCDLALPFLVICVACNFVMRKYVVYLNQILSTVLELNVFHAMEKCVYLGKQFTCQRLVYI